MYMMAAATVSTVSSRGLRPGICNSCWIWSARFSGKHQARSNRTAELQQHIHVMEEC